MALVSPGIAAGAMSGGLRDDVTTSPVTRSADADPVLRGGAFAPKRGQRRARTSSSHRPYLDQFLPNLVRGLRENPHGIQGPVVIQVLAAALDDRERGRRRRAMSTTRANRRSWIWHVLLFLHTLTKEGERAPRVAADAVWALSQVGLTPSQLDVLETRYTLLESVTAWVFDDLYPQADSS